ALPHVAAAKLGARRLLRLARLPSTSHESTGSLRPTHVSGALTLENVSFSYPNNTTNTKALSALSLHAPPAAITSITGASGAGKSTLAQLLLRLHAPSGDDGGRILLDSIACADMDTHHLRTLVALVPQTPTLFAGLTLAQNIAYGTQPPPTRADIIAAARVAAIHEFIAALP